MNEQIKKLIEQAGFEPHYEQDGSFSYRDQFEKFAELIVRECADIANKWQTSEHPGLLVKDVILYQFGVEE